MWKSLRDYTSNPNSTSKVFAVSDFGLMVSNMKMPATLDKLNSGCTEFVTPAPDLANILHDGGLVMLA